MASCQTDDRQLPEPVMSDLLHKSRNVFDKYPIMQHFVTEMCTYVYISVTKRCTVGYLSNALWDLCDRSNHWRIYVPTCLNEKQTKSSSLRQDISLERKYFDFDVNCINCVHGNSDTMLCRLK